MALPPFLDLPVRTLLFAAAGGAGLLFAAVVGTSAWGASRGRVEEDPLLAPPAHDGPAEAAVPVTPARVLKVSGAPPRERAKGPPASPSRAGNGS